MFLQNGMSVGNLFCFMCEVVLNGLLTPKTDDDDDDDDGININVNIFLHFASMG
jgi:hypothetical protein